MKPRRLLWTRREMLRAGLTGAMLPWLPAMAGGAEASAKPPERTLFLFCDWFHVKKGDLQVALDPARISAEGRKQIEMFARDFNKKFDESGHGFRPIDVPTGVRIVQEVAERSKPWLVADKSWEAGTTTPTVLFDEGRYRCWYSARLKDERQETTVDDGRVMELNGSALAYAESDDGWNWTKPELNVLSFGGSRANNLVSPYNNGGSVFRDDHGSAAERYKGFHFDALPKDEVAANASSHAKYGLYGSTSPDGYRWTLNPKPLIRYFADTMNIAGWDPLLEKYVGYFRHHLAGRAISRAETADFFDWPAPQPLLHSAPLDAPADDYYTNCYTTHPGDPSLRLLFPAIYHRDDDTVDVRLAISRDGRVFSWVSYEPIIRLGTAGEWDGGSLYAQPNLVQLPDGRLALPYDAYNTTHNEIFYDMLYKDFEAKTGIAWALWQDARLAGIHAKHMGQFTMNAAIFDGETIEVNARTTQGGCVDVELHEKGQPVPGFTFADSVPINGDALWTACRWKGGADLSALRGKYVEIAFRLRSATVFACRFA